MSESKKSGKTPGKRRPAKKRVELADDVEAVVMRLSRGKTRMASTIVDRVLRKQFEELGYLKPLLVRADELDETPGEDS